MQDCPVKRYKFMIEGFGCGREITPDYIRAFLLNLTQLIDMNLLPMGVNQDNPRAVYVSPDTGKEPGCTGDIMWLESGSQIHHWENYGYVDLWMFSCKEFEHSDVENLFRFWFKPKQIRSCVP